MADNPLEIPQALRAASEQGLKQAHTAYEQLTDFVTNAMGAWMGAVPSNPMTTRFKDVQEQIMEFATDNAEAAFTFAGKISNAKTFPDIVTVQTQFLQDRMQAFVAQTQRLFSVIQDAVQKSEHGALDAGVGTTPSNPMFTGSNPMITGSKIAIFKDVRDSAVAMSKTNAELTVALVEKLAKVENIEELLTLQTKFAQGQIQAYVEQTQELQRRIGEALRRSANG